MARRATTLHLRPATAEGWTRLTLECSLPDRLPPPVLYQMLSLLAFWSGQRLDVVLDAAHSGAWCESWADALADVPERHLRVRFDVGDEGRHGG
jgi:hypothetical protein